MLDTYRPTLVTMDGDLARRIADTWESAGSLATSADISLRLATVPDGTCLEPSSAPRTSRIDDATGADYRVAELLGRGGMGDVHAAWQTRVGRRVALKRVRPDRFDDPDLERRFRAEAAVTGSLEHPGIVPVYDLGTDTTGHAFLAMQLVAGRPWSASIRSMTLDDNLATLRRVAEAVAFAHARGFVHLDLKPANVMLGDWGEVLLCDWGLAMRIEEGVARPLCPGASIGGTPCYMAPEQAVHDRDRLGHATDVYLLGAILYEILCGRRVHAGNDARACLLAAAANRVVPPGGDPELEDLALRSLATDPRQRPASVDAFLADLRRWRIHADSNALLARARELADRCHAGDLTAGADGLRAITEARRRWPEQPHADACEGALRRTWASAALAQGDAALAVAVAPADPQLHATARAQLDTQRQQARRLRRGRTALALLAALLLVGLGTGSWLVERSATAARQRHSEAEAALACARDAAYRAQLVQAVSASQRGDRREADAALDACPPEQRDLEWRVVHTMAHETAQRVPGCDRPAHAVCWDPDGRHLWYGTDTEVTQVDPITMAITRRHAVPGGARTLAVSGTAVLVGTHAGAWLMTDGSTPPRAIPVTGAVAQVALNASFDCLMLSAGTAWRWRPDHGEAERLADGVVAVAWDEGRPVWATRTQVLLDGQPIATLTQDRIHAVLWTAGQRLLLVQTGPERENDGSIGQLPADAPPDWPRVPTWQLRTLDGRTVAEAGQIYLERDPMIAADGRGFALVQQRTRTVALHGHEQQRLRFPETVHRLASAPDGRWAVSWQCGIAIHKPAPATVAMHSHATRVPIAGIYADGHAIVLTCARNLEHGDGTTWQQSPAGPHLSHSNQRDRLVQTTAGIITRQAQTPQWFRPGREPAAVVQVALPTTTRSCWPSPAGTHLAVNLARDRWMLVPIDATTLPAEQPGQCEAWLDERHLLVSTALDTACIAIDGSVRWRIPSLNPDRHLAHVLPLGHRFAYALKTSIAIHSAEDGRQQRTFDRHTIDISSIAWSGSRLITGDYGGNLVFWDIEQGMAVACIPWSLLGITTIAADGPRLLVGSEEYLLHQWGEP